MQAQNASLLLALLTAVSLASPLWGATSSGAKPPASSSAARAKLTTTSSSIPPKGASASPSRQTKGAATPTSGSAKPPATKASAQSKSAANPGAVKAGVTTPAKTSRVMAGGTTRTRVTAAHPAAKASGTRSVQSAKRTVPRAPTRKRALATTATPSIRPPFVRLPVLDLSTSDIAPAGMPLVRSGSALVVDASGEELYAKNPDVMLPIASITKLMTAMVVLDSGAPLPELITISPADRDWIRGSSSRLQDGRATLSRLEMLQLALMSSENRAAAALARTTFPGGTQEFVAAMNRKAQSLGMTHSHFADGTGLDGQNTSTARDLVRMLRAAYEYPEIRQATTTESAEVQPYGEYRSLFYRNTNRLVRGGAWDIELSKTGYLNEAGRCLAMRTRIEDRPLYMVFLNAPGKLTPFEDSNRLRRWLESRS